MRAFSMKMHTFPLENACISTRKMHAFSVEMHAFSLGKCAHFNENARIFERPLPARIISWLVTLSLAVMAMKHNRRLSTCTYMMAISING